MQKQYQYVGGSDILESIPKKSGRVKVESAAAILHWIQSTDQPKEHDGTVVATFIIDPDGWMWVNDRRSEHVLCAAGQNVLSAGEITFELVKNDIEVVAITNQSTGYCPEPESWWAVGRALDRANTEHPGAFTTEFDFRRCDNCGMKNIVKDGWFYCGVCDEPLSQTWNFGK
ncbi:MAG: hypothetical protein AAGK74_10565 [Chloroflexota bacterium]